MLVKQKSNKVFAVKFFIISPAVIRPTTKRTSPSTVNKIGYRFYYSGRSLLGIAGFKDTLADKHTLRTELPLRQIFVEFKSVIFHFSNPFDIMI